MSALNLMPGWVALNQHIVAELADPASHEGGRRVWQQRQDGKPISQASPSP